MAGDEFILNEGQRPRDVFKLWSHKPRLRDPEERGKPSLSEGFRTKVNYRTNWHKSGDIYVVIYNESRPLYIYRSFIFPLLENKKSCAEALHIKIGKCYFCTMACRFGFIFCLTRRHRFAMGVFNNLSMTEIIREIALKSNWLTCDQYIISSCFRLIENTVLFSGY